MNINKDITSYLTNVTKYGKTALELLINKDTNEKQILDPLTTVIKIALLYFYTDGSKLSISNNTVNIHESNTFQGVIRWLYGASRNNLYNLKEPIQNCLKWFPYSRYKNLKIIYSHAILGLEKLKKSYSNKTNITIHIIEYYIKIIKDNLNETESKLIDNVDIEQSIILSDNLQKNIKTIWTIKDISLVNNFFEILITRKKENNDIKNVFISLLEFLKEKDEKIKKYIKKYTTELEI